MNYCVNYFVDTYNKQSAWYIVFDNYYDAYKALLSCIDVYAFEWTITTTNDVILTYTDKRTVEHQNSTDTGSIDTWIVKYFDPEEWDRIKITIERFNMSQIYKLKN